MSVWLILGVTAFVVFYVADEEIRWRKNLSAMAREIRERGNE